MKTSKVVTFSEKEFEKYLADRPDIQVTQEMPLSMNLNGIPPCTKKRNHLGNIPTERDGYKFQSKLEASRYSVLKSWESFNLISDLSVQFDDKPGHTYILQEGYRLPNGKKVRTISYISDFQYTQTQTGLFIVEDTKGYKTPLFKQKEKMFRLKFPDVHFFVNPSPIGWYTSQ